MRYTWSTIRREFSTARNYGDTDGLFQIMLGNPTPNRPVYKDPELRTLQVPDDSDKASKQ